MDGEVIEVEDVTISTTYGGEPALQSIWRDLTARRATERQRRALAQAEKLRALGQMAAGIAHDLNQSLMLVASYGDLARQALESESPDRDELRELFATATQAALDGGELVKRLLVFSRTPQTDEKQPVDLANLAEEVAQLTAPRWQDQAQAEGRPISLRVETFTALAPPVIMGAPARLREVFTNLLFNAIDAMPTGGTICVKVHSENNDAVVEVIDSGTGMSPEVQAHIFEPFFTTKYDAGTGLGLAMTFAIVQQHGGAIDVHSTPGQGTCFRLKFPLTRVRSSENRSLAARDLTTSPAVRALRVLAADDEPAMTRAISRMLRPQGHVVTTAESGEQALALLEAESFDVVISDMGMGAGITGFELAERVQHRWPHVRFLLATGWGAAIEPSDARRRGIEAVLAKPYRPADLQRLLASPSPTTDNPLTRAA